MNNIAVGVEDCRWAEEKHDGLTLCKWPLGGEAWCECSAACPGYEAPLPSVAAADVAAGHGGETEAYDGFVAYAHHEYAEPGGKV